MENISDLMGLKESYISHFLQLNKIKAIFKEEQKFKASITRDLQQVVECVKRDESVRTAEDSFLLKIDSFTFRRLVLPIIRQDLEVKLFCIKKLPFFSVDISNF